MKKNYEKLLINVISLDNADVITASFAVKNTSLLDQDFDLVGLNVQNF